MDNRIIADMHTHSMFSHDSTLKIEDMCIAQLNKGTNVFAVTDHCDLLKYRFFDIFEPIRNSCKEVEKLREKYDGKIKILSGIEIGDGVICPDHLTFALNLWDFDVVVTSVHEFNGNYTCRIKFDELEEDELYNFLNEYYDEILKTVSNTEFDVIAHLTYPIRYIQGVYKRNINLDKIDNIDKILKVLVERKKALEVNTSSYPLYNDFMPSEKLIKRYYESGGKYITLGSDAHKLENMSLNFNEAIKCIKNIGYSELYYYEKRKPVAYKI